VKDFIDAILESDRKAPRKQRHTAHRIHQRLKVELRSCDVSESTVRRYVGRRKRAMGWAARQGVSLSGTFGNRRCDRNVIRIAEKR
jgi:hypothetical protein